MVLEHSQYGIPCVVRILPPSGPSPSTVSVVYMDEKPYRLPGETRETLPVRMGNKQHGRATIINIPHVFKGSLLLKKTEPGRCHSLPNWSR